MTHHPSLEDYDAQPRMPRRGQRSRMAPNEVGKPPPFSLAGDTCQTWVEGDDPEHYAWRTAMVDEIWNRP